jgi:ERCC4-related helicase
MICKMELVLATELFNRDEKNFKILITLDELKVEVHLEFDETYSMWIVSEDTTDTLYQIEFSDEYEYTVEGFAKAIEKTLATLEQLYYYKPLGKYISREDKMELLKYKVFKKFFCTEDCAICFEETSVITHCKHYCCHKCMEKIKLCPICRRDLYD